MATATTPERGPRSQEAQRQLALNKTMVLETNHACNLRCIHCYLPAESKRSLGFIDRALVESLFDQFEECGFNYLLLTGGEPLAHPEFYAIYESAWDRGLFVSLFTNSLLLRDEHLDLFTRKPPAVIRISLFGGTRESYEAIAGRDLYATALERIFGLHQRGLPVRVKLPLLRQNSGDVATAHAELRARGIPAKIDVRIIPRFNHDTDVLDWRLSPEEIVELDLENTRVNLRHFEKLKQMPRTQVRTLRYCLERCQPFMINPRGELQLCFFIRDFKTDLRSLPLRQAIDRLIDTMLEADFGEPSEVCGSCQLSSFCSYCPGWARNEVGQAGAPVPFLCRTSELFYEKYERLAAAGEGGET